MISAWADWVALSFNLKLCLATANHNFKWWIHYLYLRNLNQKIFQSNRFNPFSAGIDFGRLTSVDVRLWRQKSISVLK